MLPTGAGPLLTGSSDGSVRFWDAARPEASFMVCGQPQLPSPDPAPSSPGQGAAAGQLARQNRQLSPVAYVYSHNSVQGVGVLEESCISRSTEVQVKVLTTLHLWGPHPI